MSAEVAVLPRRLSFEICQALFVHCARRLVVCMLQSWRSIFAHGADIAKSDTVKASKVNMTTP